MFDRNPAGEIRRILMIQLGVIGDVILCTAAVRQARAAFPEARIDFLTRGGGAGVIEGLPQVDNLIVYPETARERLAMFRKIRRTRYDAVVDFHSYPRTATVVALSGAKIRVGFRGRGPRNLAYTHLFPKERIAGSYFAWRKADMLTPLGVEVPVETADLRLEIAVGPEERRWAEGMWKKLGLDEARPTVAISGVSREQMKNWGPDKWAQVADTLIDSGAQVLLSHGPGEREQAAAIVENMRHTPAWDHGPTTLRQMAALYQRCAFWMGNDGGPKHLAVAAGLKTITVFRWTFAPHWTDVRPGSDQMFFEKAPPQGCDVKCHSCEHRGCLAAITPEEVIPAALSTLRATQRPAPGAALPVLDLRETRA